MTCDGADESTVLRIAGQFNEIWNSHVMQKTDRGGWRTAVSQNTDIQDIPNT